MNKTYAYTFASLLKILQQLFIANIWQCVAFTENESFKSLSIRIEYWYHQVLDKMFEVMQNNVLYFKTDCWNFNFRYLFRLLLFFPRTIVNCCMISFVHTVVVTIAFCYDFVFEFSFVRSSSDQTLSVNFVLACFACFVWRVITFLPPR